MQLACNVKRAVRISVRALFPTFSRFGDIVAETDASVMVVSGESFLRGLLSSSRGPRRRNTISWQ